MTEKRDEDNERPYFRGFECLPDVGLKPIVRKVGMVCEDIEKLYSASDSVGIPGQVDRRIDQYVDQMIDSLETLKRLRKYYS